MQNLTSRLPIRSLTAMKSHTGRNRLRNAALVSVSALAVSALGLAACHDLTEQPASAITPTSYFLNTTQVNSGLAGVYSGLRASESNYWQISEASSDEVIVPTRGSNWNDNGRWVELWQHTWGPASGAGRNIINDTYNEISSSIAKANANLQSLQLAPQSPTVAQASAEIRALRAWYYYMLQDAFGGVPLVLQPSLSNSPRVARDSIVRFVESELLAVRPQIPVTAAATGRITQGAVDAILCNLYLNWPVYTGTVTAGGLTPGQARYNDVITVANRIINSGNYTLSSNWSSNFQPGNTSSKENIFYVANLAALNQGLDFPNRTLHYNSFSNPGGWNGFSTIADTYNTWDSTDARKAVFLVGNQLTLDSKVQAYLQDGKTPLNFTPTIASLTAAGEGDGIRNNKFSLDPAHAQQYNGNAFTIFRLANVYLDRAEANFRLGNTAAALADLNLLRARVYSPASPLTTVTLQTIATERLHETFFEGKRRQDMIRFGIYDGTRQFKPSVSAGYNVLFPIPQQQLQANPLLTQNPGY